MKSQGHNSILRDWLDAAGALAFFWLLVCLPGNSFALDPQREVTQYNCQTWTRQNGLPVSAVNAIAQTTDGYLWFGTAIGLVRFDGHEFSLIDLSQDANLRSSIVTSLASAANGGLWVGLENGSFGSYTGKTFSFQGQTARGGLDMNVRSLLESKDHALWLAAERRVARLTQSGRFEDMLGDIAGTNYPNVLCGYEDHHGCLWFGTGNQGVYCWQAGKVSKLPDSQLDSIAVYSITEDSDGNIWLGTLNGLFCYDADWHRKEIPPLSEEVRALLVDQHGVLWIGTSGRGLARYRNGEYEFIQKNEGLAGDYVKSLAEDREGSLWVGTRDGISQISDVKFPIQNVTADESVKDALAVGASHRGGVWFASPGGLTYFDGTIRTYTTDDGLPNRYVKRVYEAKNGDVYFVSGSRTLVVRSHETLVAAYRADSLVVGIAEDPQGVVVSVGPELYRAGTNYFQPYVFENNEKPPLAWVLNLAASRDGSIWVACGNGIFRVKDGTFQSPPENLRGKAVGSVCEDSDGMVWGGTLEGIVRLKNGQAKFIDRKNGLFDDNIYSVVPDDLGNLWVDSGRGIFRVTRQGLNDFADGKTDRVDCVTYDGLEAVKMAEKTVQEHVACKSIDGRIWFPSSRGVVVIDPAYIPVNRVAPPVHIDYVSINGKKIAPTSSIVVPPGKGELEFQFDALTFIAPQKVHFKYRLEGYDNDWVDAANRRAAFYTNLKPGRYAFHVIAANADGVWNRTGDVVNLQLQPHFTQTIWFYLLCGAATITVLFGIYYWSVRHLEAKQRELKKNRDRLEAEVQKRTAELAQTNSSLQRESEEHKLTAIELRQRTVLLEKEIEERKQMQLEVERVHRQLVEISRQAGMSEVASNVLHNVGNVLNSVNVSATLAADIARKSKATNLAKVVELLDARADDLGNFFAHDPKGAQLHEYLRKLHGHLAQEQQTSIAELESLRKNIEHIKDIVTMQQSYAKMSGLTEVVTVADLVEDSLRMNAGALQRHEVQVVREYEAVPAISVEKHKVLQILVNLIRNAKYACDEGGQAEKRLTVRIANGNDTIKISVADNGIGIPAANLTRIFSHGFTTRKTGHGFGLHSGALAAREMGGTLFAQSDGPGQGAIFTLELPFQAPRDADNHLGTKKGGMK